MVNFDNNHKIVIGTSFCQISERLAHRREGCPCLCGQFLEEEFRQDKFKIEGASDFSPLENSGKSKYY
jgi:hypothetical protein